MSISLFFLVVFFLALIYRVEATVTITAFDKFGIPIFTTQKNVFPPSLSSVNPRYDLVQSLTVGNGTEIFEIWLPWPYGVFYDGRPFVFASALCDIVAENPRIKGKISIVGWETVTSRRICNGRDDGTLPCPDIIVLGTTQIPERFYLGEVEPLDRYFEEYTEDTGTVLEDDFFKATYYDYKIGNSWVGLPLVSDLRALYYIRQSLMNLNLTQPPPMGSW
ncbi:hypothetical protein HK102_004761, partial [Quaeritorhiza haematococci]